MLTKTLVEIEKVAKKSFSFQKEYFEKTTEVLQLPYQPLREF